MVRSVSLMIPFPGPLHCLSGPPCLYAVSDQKLSTLRGRLGVPDVGLRTIPKDTPSNTTFSSYSLTVVGEQPWIHYLQRASTADWSSRSTSSSSDMKTF